jgi:transposase
MEEKSKSGRRYDADFKSNAVGLVESGRRVSEVARDLGCSTWSLGRWVQAKQQGRASTEPKTLAVETPEQREIRRLRQDNDYLRRQRDILKKALAIVSDGNLPGASNS